VVCYGNGGGSGGGTQSSAREGDRAVAKNPETNVAQFQSPSGLQEVEGGSVALHGFLLC
jgi:hypothetical protein